MESFFAAGVIAFAATTAANLAALWRPDDALDRSARWFLGLTLVVWAGLLAWWTARHGAGGGTRLYLGLSAWSLSALYLILLRRYPIATLGSFVTAFSTMLAILSWLVSRTAPLVEGLGWVLWVHIALAFIGVTAFAFATAVSLVFLIQSRMLKQKSHNPLRKRLPPLDVLDQLALRAIVVGFPFYTVALLLGSVSAVRAGAGGIRATYLVAVVSWLIYGAVLQARLTAGWRGRRAAILTTVGLCACLVVVAQYSLRAAS